LPSLAKADRLKPFWPTHPEAFTSLVIQHAPSLSDRAFAGLVYRMPDLTTINLKGCSLAGKETVATLIKRCPALRRINLKGTGVVEDDVKKLLDRYGQGMEGFKVDLVLIEVGLSTSTISAIKMQQRLTLRM
jgi:hypothetical protein